MIFPFLTCMMTFSPLQLQELIDAADSVLARCSERQVADLQAKQQAVVENWESLKSKVEQRREHLEQACRLYQFQADVSTPAFCILSVNAQRNLTSCYVSMSMCVWHTGLCDRM